MIRCIREGMFETNSSSCHAFCVKQNFGDIKLYRINDEPNLENIDCGNDKLKLDNDGSLTIYLDLYTDGEYFLRTPNEKLNYLTTYFFVEDCCREIDFSSKLERDEFNRDLNELLDFGQYSDNSFINKYQMYEFFSKIKEISNANKIIIDVNDDMYDVDYSSRGVNLDEIIRSSGIGIEGLILNRNVVIYVSWEFSEDEEEEAKERAKKTCFKPVINVPFNIIEKLDNNLLKLFNANFIVETFSVSKDMIKFILLNQDDDKCFIEVYLNKTSEYSTKEIRQFIIDYLNSYKPNLAQTLRDKLR